MSLQILSETFFTISRYEGDMIKIYNCLDIKYPSFFSDFIENCTVSTDFRKILNSKFNQNPPSGSHVFPYGQTHRCADMTKLIVAF